MKLFKADLGLLLLAIIWGTSFPLIKNGIQEVGAFNHLGFRYFLAALILLLVSRSSLRQITSAEIKAGLWLGLCLGVGNIFQAIGIQYSTASKTGFITSLYIVLVPFLSKMILKTKIHWKHWVGVNLCLIGLFLMSVSDSLEITKGDSWVMFCPIAYAVQVVLVSYYGKDFSAVHLNIFQLLFASLISLFCAFFLEGVRIQNLTATNLYAFIYLVLIGTVFVFTYHLKLQPKTNPIRASLILSLEAPFAAIFSMWWIHESMTAREGLGAALMLLGVIFTELRFKSTP